MKISINKSAKRVMSIVIAIAMFVGTLFVANVGVAVQTSASTKDVSNLKISYWDGKFETGTNGFSPTDPSILNETNATGTSANDPIIIDNANELATLVRWSSYKSTAGYFFKLSDAYDVYILQSSSVVDAAELMGLSSGAETKAYFEDPKFAGKLFDWGQCCNNGSFAGNFDGNGVEIYGLYVNPVVNGSSYARENVGLFGGVDPGVLGAVQTGNGGVKTYNDQGNFFKNVIVKNSYYYGSRRMGGIAANSNGPNYGCSSNGIVYFDSCVVANSYMYCTGNHTGTPTNNVDNNGVIAAYPDGNDTYFIDNCLVYGNVTYNEHSKKPFDILGNVNTYTNASGTATTGKVTNCIAIGTRPVIYTKSTTPGYAENNYTFFDIETLRGAAAMAWAEGLNWGTDWFAVEGEYPTPIKPAKYLSADQKPNSLYSAGKGTKDDPYIIRSVDQLSQMVKEQSYTDSYTEAHTNYKSDGTTETKSITSYRSKYYKVADGVDELYINNVKTQEEANALYSTGGYNNWPTAEVFAGNFDGNGVTIYGLMGGSSFVKKVDGTHAAIKNVHFKAAHIESGSYAAVVTTNFGTYGYGYTPEVGASTIWFNRVQDPTTGESVNNYLIANVSVTESYIKSTQTGSNGNATAGGIVVLTTTPPFVTMKNCFFDGVSSALIDGTAGAGANPASTKAGIVAMHSAGTTNRWIISDCVSINEYPVSMKSGTDYNRFTANSGGGTCEISNFYGPINSEINFDTYPKFSQITNLDVKNVYDYSDIPTIDWAGTWKLVKVNNDRVIPMPLGVASDKNVSYPELVSKHNYDAGAYDGHGVTGFRGKYGWQVELAGSGTEEDPYLITNALQLAQAIGCGAKGIHGKLYYKLTCDIDLTGSTWINQASIGSSYVYVPFEGVLDGAGHTVTGLSASDKSAAGLIPVLNGGTVKNVHVRNAFIVAPGATAGVIVGQVDSGNIENCSVESSTTIGATTNVITGNAYATSNCYYVVDGKQTFSSDVDKDSLKLCPAADAQWYKGTDGIYRHVSFAMANSVTDVDGDGIVEEVYGASDIVALRNHLLNRTGYENIFGDVSRNGVVNISDLAILRRRMSDDFSGLTDGFWRNLELGNVAIYYAENDTYDMARKLELYFESINPKVDVLKYAGAAVTDTSVTLKGDYTNQVNAVVITQGTPTADTYDDYSITFDSSKNVLTIYGGSFTAVEQAVKEFIANADPTDSTTVYTTNGTKSILSLQDTTKDANSSSNHYLSYKTIEDMDGTVHTVYYAWGDEFEGTGSFSTDNWSIRNYRNEGSLEGVKPTDEAAGDTRYLNLEGGTVESIPDLWEVNGGKLTIWRGVSVGEDYSLDVYDTATKNAYNSGSYSWGYKPVYQDADYKNTFGRDIDDNDIFVDPGLLQTSSTMMYKQGYSEMRAALPNDGHAFPAWWFMTGAGQKSMTNFENFYLYDKVYKINSKWDGKTMNTDPTDLTTYKYEMPQAFLEYDIVEFMQAQSGTTGRNNSKSGITTGDYRDYINLTIHKYYNQHVKDGMLYLPDWSTGGYVSGYNGITQSSFNTTSSSGDNTTFIHRFDPSRTTSAHPDTVVTDYWLWEDESQTPASYSVAQAIKNGKLASGSKVQDIYTYGYWWSVNEAAGTYDIVVYVDFNNDGNMAKSEMIFHINETNGHEMNDPTWGNKPTSSSSKGKDAAIWNQYAYMLIDNAFYTCNSYGVGSSSSNEVGVKLFTDLLTQESGDKTTFDLEYVRVYQEDGRRDLVTNETENFNTGNRYGY